MKNSIKIIDLFAGPGGLSEGFSSLLDTSGNRQFDVALSVEKDASAHSTLELRAFYRQFRTGSAPREYFDYLEGKLGKYPKESLYKHAKFRKQVEAAKSESQNLTLGTSQNRKIYSLISEKLGNRPGPWVLIGGPPCQAYSLAGRVRNQGVEGYKAEEDHRNYLYLEYLKVIARFRPAVFVMENVKGLLSAKVNGIPLFQKIYTDLQCPEKAVKTGSKVTDYEIFSLSHNDFQSGDLIGGSIDPKKLVIRSEDYGIPQARHRVILLGIRKNIAAKVFSKILEPEVAPCVKEVISDLPALRSGLSKQKDTYENWVHAITHNLEEIIDDVSASKLDYVAREMERVVKRLDKRALDRGSNWATKNPVTKSKKMDPKLTKWFQDESGWTGFCNHETRGHIEADLHRYLFCACYGRMNKSKSATPKSNEFPKSLIPNHTNWESGHFADRFRVQAAGNVATTITSHISKDGHYYIHYDPEQCRSLTVREAARIQTFPDNYFFVGNRTQQYTQVGNAVPPLLAKKIAAVVYEILNSY